MPNLVEAPDGRTWATLLATHTIDGVDGLLGRQTHLVPVAWEGGRPLFAPGSGRVEHVVEAEGVPIRHRDPARSVTTSTIRSWMPAGTAPVTTRAPLAAYLSFSRSTKR